MWWMNTRRSHSASERGAVAVLVALLISGMLLALGAFVTDVGSWYAERAQLQNGADAAALAVAQTCAQGLCDAGLTNGHTAPRYANQNANDSLTYVDRVCGNGPGLLPCPVDSSCPTGTGNHVTVRTETLENGGSHLLPPMFGDLLLGSSYDGETIRACATAAWGGVSGGSGLAMTISLCAWKHATVDGLLDKFAPAPPYATWPPLLVLAYPYVPLLHVPPAPGLPGGEQVLMFHGSSTACLGAESGWTLPGGFGYLQENGGPCASSVTVDNTYADTPGNSITSACAAELAASTANHTVMYMPVFDGWQMAGANGIYHLAGFAAFVLTGGYLNGEGGGFKVPSTIGGRHYCSGEDRCLYGFFTQGLVPHGVRGGTSWLPGVYTTQLTV